MLACPEHRPFSPGLLPGILQPGTEVWVPDEQRENGGLEGGGVGGVYGHGQRGNREAEEGPHRQETGAAPRRALGETSGLWRNKQRSSSGRERQVGSSGGSSLNWG